MLLPSGPIYKCKIAYVPLSLDWSRKLVPYLFASTHISSMRVIRWSLIITSLSLLRKNVAMKDFAYKRKYYSLVYVDFI